MDPRQTSKTHKKKHRQRKQQQRRLVLADETQTEEKPIYHGLYVLESNIFNKHLNDYGYFERLFNEKIGYFKTREFHRLNLRMKHSINEIWSADIDEKYRFLCMRIRLDNGKTVFCLLDVIPHTYDKNKYMNMNRQEMDAFKETIKAKIQSDLQFLESLEKVSDDDDEIVPSIHLKQHIDFIGNKFITFDRNQTEAINARTRFIGLGAPNTGKSIIGIESLKNYVIWLDEQGNDDGGDIYCVAQSQELIATLMNIWNQSNLPERLKQRVQFVTCRGLLEKYYDRMPSKPILISTDEVEKLIKTQINFKKYQSDCKLDKLNTVAKDLFDKDSLDWKIVYQELRIMYGYTKNEYIGDDTKPEEIIGSRESKFGGKGKDGRNKERRAYLWEKKAALQAYFDRNNLLHAEFAQLPEDIKIKFLWADEFQDFPPALLYSILKATDLNCIFTGDEHQNIFWARSIINYINKMTFQLSNKAIKELKIIMLPITHEISEAVKCASNRALKLKIYLTGGLNYKKQYTEVNNTLEDKIEGKDEWITIDEKQGYRSLKNHPSIIDLYTKIENNPQNFLVIIPNESFRECAQELFPPGTITLTIAQAKGQHYHTAILLAPFDHPQFQDEFTAANTKMEENNIRSEEDIIINNNLASREAETEGGFCNYFTAISRGLRNEVVLQELRKNNAWIVNYFKPKPTLKPANLAQVENNEKVEAQKSEDNKDQYQERLEGLKKLIINNNMKAAEDFYDHFMKLQYHLDVDFADFCAQFKSNETKKEEVIKEEPSSINDTDREKPIISFSFTANNISTTPVAVNKSEKTANTEVNDKKPNGTTNNNKTNSSENKNASRGGHRGRGRDGRVQGGRNIKPSNPQVNKEQQTVSKPRELSKDKIDKFSDALANGQVGYISKFIKQYPEAHTIKIYFGDKYIYPLHYAIFYDKPAVVKVLLSAPKVDVNMTDGYGSTPLYFAIKSKYKEIIQALLDRNELDINKKFLSVDNHSNHSISPLRYALQIESPLGVDLLCKHKKIVISDDDFEFSTTKASTDKFKADSSCLQFLLKKYATTKASNLIMNFNEDSIIEILKIKGFMSIIGINLDIFKDAAGTQTIFSFILSDASRMNIFLQCMMKKDKDGKLYLFRLLEEDERSCSHGKDYFNKEIDAVILANLNVDQLLIAYDDHLYMQHRQLNDENKEINDKVYSRIKNQIYMREELDPDQRLSRSIELGLIYATQMCLQAMEGVEYIVHMFNFIKTAIANNDTRMVQVLLDAKQKDLTQKELLALLRQAVRKNNLVMFNSLLTHIKGDQPEIDFNKLYNEANELKSELVAKRIKEVIDEHEMFKNAIESNSIGLVKKYIEDKKALNVNCKIDGLTPLHIAIRNQNEELVKVLLKSDDINFDVLTAHRDFNPPMDALTLAATTQNLNIIALLINDNRLNVMSDQLEYLIEMAINQNNVSIRDSLLKKHCELSLHMLEKNNYDMSTFINLFTNSGAIIITTIFRIDFIDLLDKKPEICSTFINCLMKLHNGIDKVHIKNGDHYVYRLFMPSQESFDLRSEEFKIFYIKSMERIFEKMSTEQLFLILNDICNRKPNNIQQNELWMKLIINHTRLKKMSIKDRIDHAIILNHLSITKYYLQDKNTHLSDKEISLLLVLAVEKDCIDTIDSLFNIIKLEQLLKIDFKTALNKAKVSPEIAKKLSRANYFAGLLNRFNNVNVAKLLTSRDVITLLFNKDVAAHALNGNLITTIMANPDWSKVFIECLFAPHGAIVEQNKAIAKIDETYIKKGQPYIERFDRTHLFKIVEILLEKSAAGGNVSQLEKEAVSKILDDDRIDTRSHQENIILAIELNLLKLVQSFFSGDLGISPGWIKSFLEKAIEKNNLNIVKIILADEATLRAISENKICVQDLYDKAVKVNMEIAKAFSPHLKTSKSFFTPVVVSNTAGNFQIKVNGNAKLEKPNTQSEELPNDEKHDNAKEKVFYFQ